MRSTPCSDGTRWSRERPAGSAPTSPVSWPAAAPASCWWPGARTGCGRWSASWATATAPRSTWPSWDLTADGAPEELRRRVADAGRPADVLVNNAGYGLYGRFIELDWERERNMLELDMIVRST